MSRVVVMTLVLGCAMTSAPIRSSTPEFVVLSFTLFARASSVQSEPPLPSWEVSLIHRTPALLIRGRRLR